MKKQLIYGILIIIFGLLIAAGPRFLFKVCGVEEESFPRCHWSAMAETGMGIIIAGLGICVLLFLDEAKTILGLSIGIFFTGASALLIPNALIGGCSMMTMRCRRIAFPVLSVLCVVLLLCSISNIVYLEIKNRMPDR